MPLYDVKESKHFSYVGFDFHIFVFCFQIYPSEKKEVMKTAYFLCQLPRKFFSKKETYLKVNRTEFDITFLK